MYPNFSVFLSDNSETSENAKFITENYNIECGYIEPIEGETVFERIARSHNQIRDYFIKNKQYTHLLHLETDIFPPIDIIDRLLAHDKPVVAANYDVHFGGKRKLMVQLSEPYHSYVRSYRCVPFVDEQEPLFFDGTIKKVFHAGLGCVLIRREIVELLPFRVAKGENFMSADTYWANDMFANNVPIMVDTNINCKHENISWMNNMAEIKSLENN
jgi:hypothetical protein